MKSTDQGQAQQDWFSRYGRKGLGALPVGVFLILMIVLILQGSTASFESPDLLAALNTLFLCAIPLFVAYLATRSYRSTGILAFLIIGAGLVFL